MNSNDSLNGKNKQSNIRLRHMFQGNNDDNNGIYIPDTLDNEKLKKISLRFESKNQKQMSIVDSVKQIIELSETDPTKSLLDYIEGLKSLYKSEPDPNDEEIVEDSIEEVDIDAIISKSEKSIFQHSDQKSMLFDLINDINKSSNTKSKYNDEDFEKNIAEILSSPDDVHDVKDMPHEIDRSEDNNTVEENEISEEIVVEDDVQIKKGSKVKRYAFLLFVILGLTIIFYLYNEQIFSLYDQMSERIIAFVSDLNL